MNIILCMKLGKQNKTKNVFFFCFNRKTLSVCSKKISFSVVNYRFIYVIAPNTENQPLKRIS